MVHGLAPFGLRGAIWYQGEINGNEGVEYFHKMQALIGGWRKFGTKVTSPCISISFSWQIFKHPTKP